MIKQRHNVLPEHTTTDNNNNVNDNSNNNNSSSIPSINSRQRRVKKVTTTTSSCTSTQQKYDKYNNNHRHPIRLLAFIPKDILIAIITTFLLTTCTVLTLLRFNMKDMLLSYLITRYPDVLDKVHNGQQQQQQRHQRQRRDYNNNNAGGGGNNVDNNNDDEENLGLNPLPFNPIYQIPGSMKSVGDRSDSYVTLRKLYDTELLPPNQQRSLQYVTETLLQNNQQHNNNNHNNIYSSINSVPIPIHNSDTINAPYNIYDCPDIPPVGYPYHWNIMDVLTNWPVDIILPPQQIHQGLCIFDYITDYDKALAYRIAEVPFVVQNDPTVAQTVERWNTPNYMEQLLGDVLHRTEYSENNHFMYYNAPKHPPKKTHNVRKHSNGIEKPPGWKAPTQMLRMEYKKWLEHANVTMSTTTTTTTTNETLLTDRELYGPDRPHWYYRLIGCGGMGNDGSCDKGSSEYLYDELPFFQPKSSLYIVDPVEQKGIHCRFGMKGVIAENHFDASRNMIVLLKGTRRYILSHPNQCDKLALYPKRHPSARHSAVDWSHPNTTSIQEESPEFYTASVNEVILQPGQVLYLPTDWFHFIVSLELNFQCNTRSGATNHYIEHLKRCGF